MYSLQYLGVRDDHGEHGNVQEFLKTCVSREHGEGPLFFSLSWAP